MKKYLMIDFGSTFTKLTAIDVEKKEIIGTSKSFTTIETDVMEGYNNALEILHKEIGNVEFDGRYASSSAAGGLKMVSVGLVPELTAKASRLAATSAGAKVLKTYSYELTNQEKKEIEEIQPDIILLTGGIDGGNKDVVIHNATILAEAAGDFYMIYSGNKTVADEVKEIIEKNGKRKLVVCENVMPTFNKLNIDPTKRAIRDLFIENIIKAKGLSKAQEFLDSEIIPTPLSVFQAAELYSYGTQNEIGVGDLMVFDVGGATTDVYSMADGAPSGNNIILEGMMEPYNKRTVEGDIGMRYSLPSLVDVVGADVIANNAGVTIEDVTECVATYVNSPETVPKYDSKQKLIDDEFASSAIRVSSTRHCGTHEKSMSLVGEITIQRGKDLTKVKQVIGTGGAVINSENTKEILENALYTPLEKEVLKPISPMLFIDEKNILAAMGLLSTIYPKVAIEIMRNEFIKL